MPKRIPIATAKAVADKHDLKQVLLIGWDGERTHVVTYGKTKADCTAAAKAQDFWAGRIREFSFRGETEECKRCDGDKFISGAFPNSPDEPCPVCNSGAPSGAERVRLSAKSVGAS